ncbi:MAG: hypothetical protein K8R99_01495 [Actinomycetia bacterium]|nr:hypothetical protein [Actinomycetes bacterium]
MMASWAIQMQIASTVYFWGLARSATQSMSLSFGELAVAEVFLDHSTRRSRSSTTEVATSMDERTRSMLTSGSSSSSLVPETSEAGSLRLLDTPTPNLRYCAANPRWCGEPSSLWSQRDTWLMIVADLR